MYPLSPGLRRVRSDKLPLLVPPGPHPPHWLPRPAADHNPHPRNHGPPSRRVVSRRHVTPVPASARPIHASTLSPRSVWSPARRRARRRRRRGRRRRRRCCRHRRRGVRPHMPPTVLVRRRGGVVVRRVPRIGGARGSRSAPRAGGGRVGSRRVRARAAARRHHHRRRPRSRPRCRRRRHLTLDYGGAASRQELDTRGRGQRADVPRRHAQDVASLGVVVRERLRERFQVAQFVL